MMSFPYGPKWLFSALAFAGAVLFIADARAQGHSANSAIPVKAGTLTITEPWSRATPGGAKVAGGYVTITNTGTAPDKLVGGTALFAGRIEIHEMTVEGGVMRMRPLDAGLQIKPGETVVLKPGGFHVMFMDIKQQLKQDDIVKVVLQFEKAGAVELNFRVGAVGESAAPATQRH